MAAPARPTGEVTFLFTDIEGSTRLVDALGTAAWRPILARHRELIRAALAAEDGLEIGTEGDSFFAVFLDPAAAVRSVAIAQRALAAEAWPEGGEVRVRMGLHTGIGELDADGSYVGHDVHRAARVSSAANGGQVLLSEVTSSLVEGHLAPGLSLRPLGAHRLKDLRPERIAQLDIDGLPGDFPPIHSIDARPNNLPLELTSFVGRERELEETRALLGTSRLVTLTGPGGTGKTRLALQVAALLVDEYPDGTWFVPLGTITDSALVMPAIARAIGIGDDPSRSPIDVVGAELGSKNVLLVLDNFEQVRGAATDVGELLRRAGKVRILATSRAPLRVSGEQEYPVPGLPSPPDVDRLGPLARERLPAGVRSGTPEALAAFESVRLFVARGGSVKPGFAVTSSNAGDVAAIVAHLGGVPLAIELAAARLRFLTPAAIHERLEGRLDLPGAGAADVPERQRSLRGTIMWSYELLDPPACRLFQRLAVFMGGFDVARAEGVAGPASDLGIDVLDGLASLVDQSLVRSDEIDGEPRFSMLEPIREYALERLEASGDIGAVAERHAKAFLALSRELEPDLAGDRQRTALDRLELEHANLRAAIDWGDASSDAEVALGITAAIWRFWQKRGYLREARARVAALIARPWFATAPAPLRARTHEVMGGIIYWHGLVDGSRPDYEAALAIWREIGDEREIANAAYNLSFCYTMGILGPLPPDAREQADALLAEALAIYQSLGDVSGEANVYWGIGIQHYFAQDNAAAAQAFEAALALNRKVGDRTQEAWSLHQLGSARLKLGDTAVAHELLAEGLRMFAEAGDVAGVTLGLDHMAAVAVSEGDLPRAARLSGLARRIQASSGTGLAGVVESGFEVDTRATASQALAADELARYEAEGSAMPLPEGVRYALGEIDFP
ncbi:MAG TPA: tetratricopeptide repeat protein [Candidatus Limnocylindrales bacterium]